MKLKLTKSFGSMRVFWVNKEVWRLLLFCKTLYAKSKYVHLEKYLVAVKDHIDEETSRLISNLLEIALHDFKIWFKAQNTFESLKEKAYIIVNYF